MNPVGKETIPEPDIEKGLTSKQREILEKTYYYTFRFYFYLLPSEARPLPLQMPEIDMFLFCIPCHP